MTFNVFRAKKTINGKPYICRSYRGRYRLNGQDKIHDIPLHTTDKRVAIKRLEEIVRDKQLEAVGMLPPAAIRNAFQSALDEHLSEYVSDLHAMGRDNKYVREVNKRVQRLMRECGWKQLKDVTSNSFLKWRAKQTHSPKTLNDYLDSIRSLLNWMENHQRMERNPLKHIQKVQSNGRQFRPRRAFTHDEFVRLLAVAGARKVVYLMAVFTGLRRAEMQALEWDDLHLEAKTPFLKARSATTKNKKDAIIALHPELVTELLKLYHESGKPSSGSVFKKLIPRMKLFRSDMKRAGVEYVNAKGQTADLHAIRHTLATNLALAGTAPRIAMEVMRHSDMRLTSKTYTDTGLLPLTDAVTSLPSFTASTKPSSLISSLNSPRASQDGATLVNNADLNFASQPVDNESIDSPLTSIVAPSQEKGKWCAMQGSNLCVLSDIVQSTFYFLTGKVFSNSYLIDAPHSFLTIIPHKTLHFLLPQIPNER